MSAALFVCGCASLPDDLRGARDSWSGASYEEVAKRWGAPVRSEVRKDGAEEHAWVSEGYRKVAPSTGVVIGSGGLFGIGASLPFGSSGAAVRCDRTLVFREGKVVEGRWTGPADYCNTLAR